MNGLYRIFGIGLVTLANAAVWPVYGQAEPDTLATKSRADSAFSAVTHVRIPAQADAISFAEVLPGNAKIHVTESGVTGAAPQLMIRGMHSIHLNVTPQVFVDGVPVRYNRALPSFLSTFEPTRFSFINPHDIGEIYIANGGMELAEIGGRGANGAVYITTERGEFGGTQIDFTANYGISPARYQISRMGADDFKRYLWAYMAENGTSERELADNPLFDTVLPQYSYHTDWMDMITRTAAFNDYHLKLKGGDGDANYLFSLGYADKEGTLIGSDMHRIGMRFNLDYQLSQKFKITNNLAYANTSVNYLEQGSNWEVHPVYVAATKAPFMGRYAYNEENQLTNLLADVDVLGKSNPWALVNNMSNDNEENRVDGSISATWQASEQTSLTSVMAVNYFNLKEKQYRPALGIVSDRNRVRQNAQRSSSEFTLLWNTHVDHEGRLADWARYHGRVGAWIERFEEKAVYGRKINAGTDDYETLEQGTVDSASNTKFLSNLMRFYAGGDIRILDRATVAANLSVEGTSNFGGRGRWNVYPGVEATVDVLKPGEANQLRLRASWGMSGNHDVRGFYHHNLYYPVGYFGYGGTYFGNVGNMDIRPEITNTVDGGLMANLFDNRAAIDVGYYYKRTHDLITSKALPIEIGLGPQFENRGVMYSHGLELAVNAQLLPSANRFSLSVFGNLATLNSHVESLGNGNVIKTLDGVHGMVQTGGRMGSFYGYRLLGVFGTADAVDLNKADGTPYMPGDYIIDDLNEDGLINDLDRQVIGSALPTVFGGFGTTVGWDRWSLGAQFAYAYGQDIYNRFNQRMHLMSDYSNQSPGVADRWRSPEEQGSGFSRGILGDPSFNGAATDKWIEDGGYMRLKYVTLSYQLDTEYVLRFLRGVQVFVTGENLWTRTNYSGMDPEVVSYSDPLMRGIDFGASPLPRTFLMGVKISL
ncbi:SusC/RagA family TonB-linked outer membrane protein [Parapedobacter sp. 10938]|uniref:SusC/RagA family TonB-linked outer membrane protein n=1 Tax=Parapedobacter flavus TaxID=3110225 RepID=UPI002DBC09EA|nr:SusC/RagA family TonB-linked outer membrane protein [Parapedobacter sp. 10938]MEC3878981.1 SusC/RagA family TonB-linked outer membrane protein [Parapedobacter sp. 10938]